MTYEMRQAYTEVYQVLQNMPEEYVNKIPQKILELLNLEKLENYKVRIHQQNPIDKSKLSKQAMTILAILNYQYWCPNRKVKNDLYKIYFQNEENTKKDIQKNLNNLFEDKQNNFIHENVALIKYKTSVFAKIAHWFKKIFYRS